MSEAVDELRGRLRSLRAEMDDLSDEVAEVEERLHEAEHECPNCGGQTKIIGEPCSRRCRLQLEWAAELKARREGSRSCPS